MTTWHLRVRIVVLCSCCRSLVYSNTSLRRYFQPTTNLLMSSQTYLSPIVLREVNQAVTALQREENGSQLMCPVYSPTAPTCMQHSRSLEYTYVCTCSVMSLKPHPYAQNVEHGLPHAPSAFIRFAMYVAWKAPFTIIKLRKLNWPTVFHAD